jgi:glycosyltransferase involved in cell wall biosynthesis
VKILHVPFGYFPDPVAGTEVYVAALARCLSGHGIESVIAAPADRDTTYEYEGLLVERFAAETANLAELYGKGSSVAARSFERILDRVAPDLVHLHAFTAGGSLQVVREASRRRLPVVFTYHTPTVSCQRGTLMRWGKEVCDGRLRLDLCTRCTLNGLGLPRPLATLVGRVPPAAGRALGATPIGGPLATALRMRELVSLRHDSFRGLMHEVDCVVATSNWVEQILLDNSVPHGKITVSHYGIIDRDKPPEPSTPRVGVESSPLRIAFMGRLDPVKGADTLVRAVTNLPDLDIQLDVFGIAQGDASRLYLRTLQSIAAGDTRIRFLPTVPNDDVVDVLRGYHLLAVPSRWLETGPLVVLEAFAAGVPIIGSNLGGIAELVDHGKNGLLLAPEVVEEWQTAISGLYRDRALLADLRAGVRPPRTMKTVAAEMLPIYQGFH